MADEREVKKQEIVVGLTNNLHKLFKIRNPPKPKSNAAEVEKEKRVLKAAEVEKELSEIPKPRRSVRTIKPNSKYAQ